LKEKELYSLLQAKRGLFSSDIHDGFEEHLASRGVHLPSQSSTMAERLLKIKESKGCDSLIMLGDVKDYIMGMEPKAIHYLNSFINPLLKEFKHISIVPGNHDAGLEPFFLNRFHLLEAEA